MQNCLQYDVVTFALQHAAVLPGVLMHIHRVLRKETPTPGKRCVANVRQRSQAASYQAASSQSYKVRCRQERWAGHRPACRQRRSRCCAAAALQQPVRHGGVPAFGLALERPPARRRSCLQRGTQGPQQHTAPPARTGTWARGLVLLPGCCRPQPASRKRPAAQLSQRREHLRPGTWALLPTAQRHAVALLAWHSHAAQRRGRGLRCMDRLRAAALPQRRSRRLRPRTTVAQSRSWSHTRRQNGACRGGCRWTLTTRRPRLVPSRRASCCCLGRCSPLARCAALSCWHQTSEVINNI